MNLKLTAFAMLSVCAVGANAAGYIMGFSGGTANYLDVTYSGGGGATFDTSMGLLGSGMNQGWWSGNSNWTNGDGNDNTFAGDVTGGPDYLRDFFTFDLSTLAGPVASATLRLGSTYDVTGSNNFNLFDVSTSAAVLNVTTGFDATIWSDLGSGHMYGSSFVTPGDSYVSDWLIGLNAAAVADINASAGGYFSIGGTFEVVPEPASFAALGLGALVMFRRRK